ncbi:MAG: DUF3303 domain-containing protein [Candidatus Kariarchaeaceae archaeon]|jgi:hypothetical protein
MKFLVISKFRPGPMPENIVDIYRAAKEWINAKKADGTIDFVYSIVPRGGVAITNADTGEKAFDDFLSYPLFPFLDWKIKPLADFDHSLDSVIRALSR